jgi:disulfide bond formation protein DsbB
MLKQILTGKHYIYWLALLGLGLLLEGMALIYQYALDFPPCVLCIHVRLWVMLMILVAGVGCLVYKTKLPNGLAHVLMAGVMAGMLERAWLLLGTERGFVLSSCNFNLGLPAWFAPDKWLPSIFEVQATCGYTPELFFGITMAESLVVMSTCLLLLSTALAITVLASRSE